MGRKFISVSNSKHRLTHVARSIGTRQTTTPNQVLVSQLKFVLIKMAQNHTSYRRARNHVLRRAHVISAGQVHTNIQMSEFGACNDDKAGRDIKRWYNNRRRIQCDECELRTIELR